MTTSLWTGLVPRPLEEVSRTADNAFQDESAVRHIEHASAFPVLAVNHVSKLPQKAKEQRIRLRHSKTCSGHSGELSI
jgi:hypothetical protein